MFDTLPVLNLDFIHEFRDPELPRPPAGANHLPLFSLSLATLFT
jgi:hypothetical protein